MQVEYFLKWMGYPETDNTWEKEEYLMCPAMIKEYEEEVAKKLTIAETANGENEEHVIDLTDCNDVTEKKAVRILGAKNTNKLIVFLMKWDDGSASIVSAEECRIKWPQEVIKFYENRIMWKQTID